MSRRGFHLSRLRFLLKKIIMSTTHLTAPVKVAVFDASYLTAFVTQLFNRIFHFSSYEICYQSQLLKFMTY